MNQDLRIAELKALAHDEGLRLPYPVDYIAWLEDRGRIVDLMTGRVYNAVIATPTPAARAVAYLLGDMVGEVAV